MRFQAIFNQRCPRCLHGKIFADLWSMNELCPECGLEFEREAGYFLGAMYFSYGLSIISGAPVCILLFFLGIPSLWIFLAVSLQLGLSIPWIYRYSRVLWLHVDQILDPR